MTEYEKFLKRFKAEITWAVTEQQTAPDDHPSLRDKIARQFQMQHARYRVQCIADAAFPLVKLVDRLF